MGEQKRIPLLDGWRGSAVLLMLFWHLGYDLAQFGLLPAGLMESAWAALVRYVISFSFVLLAGISCHLSHNNLRRGVKTLLCAALVTLATWAFGAPAWFGILHLLGCGMLLSALLGKRLEGVPETKGAFFCLALFAVWLVLSENVRVETPLLWLIGLRRADFFSSDYYPLLPWLFLFFAGAFLGKKLCREEEKWREIEAPRVLCFLGKHALAVYLVHQPVFLAILTLYTEHQ